MYQLVPENRVQFGKVLSQSLTLFWHHRSLWVASLIAGFLGQGRVSPSLNVSQSQPFPQTAPGEIPNFGQLFEGTIFADFIRNPVPYLVIGGAIWLVWGLITIIFGSWAAGALICMVDEIDHTGGTSLGSGWRQARTRLGTFISLRLLIVLPVLLAGALILLTLMPLWLQLMRTFLLPPEQMGQAMQNFDPASLGGLFCVIPLVFCLFFPVSIVLAAISLFAERACLLEQLGTIASLRRGWQILRGQIGYSILAWVVMIFLNIILGVVMMLPIFPFWWSTSGHFFEQGFSTEVMTNMAIVIGYLILASLTFGSIIGGWTSVFWTKLYKAFTNLP